MSQIKVDDVMADVVTKMKIVTDHLGKHKQPETAHDIATYSREILTLFTDAIVDLPENDLFVDVPIKQSVLGAQQPEKHDLKENRPPKPKKHKKKKNRREDEMDLMVFSDDDTTDDESEYDEDDYDDDEHDDDSDEVDDSYENDNDNEPLGPGNRTVLGERTNEHIGYAINTHNPPPPKTRESFDTESLRPPSIPSNISGKDIPISTPFSYGGAFRARPLPCRSIDCDDHMAASIIFQGPRVDKLLSHVTSKITQGPLFSVDFNYALHQVRVTFLHANHAIQFLSANRTRKLATGSSILGNGWSLVRADMTEWDNRIRTMTSEAQNLRARRRLMFSRAGFINHDMPWNKFIRDILAVVRRKDYIECMWVINTGNVSTIFNSVEMAIRVRNEFMKKAASPGPYHGINVLFTADPCERPGTLRSKYESTFSVFP